MSNLTCMLLCALMTVKGKAVSFMKKERGGSEIIAIVLVIAVVLVLAGIFWDKISVFFEDLWNSVVGKNPIDDMHK